MADYTLKSNVNNVPQKTDVLKSLLEQAENKGNHLDKLRQLNLSVSLFIFAGLFGFGISQNHIFIRLSISVVLTLFMLLLSSYDHSLHKYLHGWRRTKVELINMISGLINDPSIELKAKTYYVEGEEKAEQEDCDNLITFLSFIKKEIFKKKPPFGKGKIPSRMRVFFYILIRGAILTIILFIIMRLESLG